MGVAFCFIGGCPGFGCYLFSVSLIVRFVLINFSEFLIFFPDYLVFVVLLPIFRIVQLISRGESKRSNGFMSSRSVISIGENRTLSCYRNFSSDFNFVLNNLLVFFCYRQYFFGLFCCLSGGIIVTRDPVSTINFFSVPSFFIVMVI